PGGRCPPYARASVVGWVTLIMSAVADATAGGTARPASPRGESRRRWPGRPHTPDNPVLGLDGRASPRKPGAGLLPRLQHLLRAHPGVELFLAQVSERHGGLAQGGAF